MPTYVLGYKDIKTRIPPVRVLRGGGGEGSIDSARQVQTEGVILKGICVLRCIVQVHPEDKALHTHLHHHKG